MTETWFCLKDFKWMASLRGEGHLRPAPQLPQHCRALLASVKLLFLFPSFLGWILTLLYCCWSSIKDPYWIHNLQYVPSQVEGNKEAQWWWRRPWRKGSNVNFCLLSALSAHIQKAGDFGEPNGREEWLVLPSRRQIHQEISNIFRFLKCA